MHIRPCTPGDVAWVLALNAAHETETSPLDAEALAQMIAAALVVRVADPEAGALIVFGPAANYHSPNYRWFQNRGRDFAYVDRVLVASHARRQGIARRFYEEAMTVARAQGLAKLTCEVNVDPPNPASDAFHERLGFVDVGEARLSSGKVVRYLQRDLT